MYPLTDKQREYLTWWKNYFGENKTCYVIMPFYKGEEHTKGEAIHIYLAKLLLRGYYQSSDKKWLNGLRDLQIGRNRNLTNKL